MKNRNIILILIIGPPCSCEDNVERANMIKSLVRVKEVVGETAKQFNLSQKEVLRMASDQERSECDPALNDHLTHLIKS